jgi:hypothetical protein
LKIFYDVTDRFTAGGSTIMKKPTAVASAVGLIK